MTTADTSAALQRPRPWTLGGLLLTDLWREPLTARSRTGDRLGHIDFAMVIPPIRAFFYCMCMPYLSYPIAAVSAFGFYRCLRSLELPSFNRKEQYSKHFLYAVQKRSYDARTRRLTESQVESVEEIAHALEVTAGVRNRFMDDPNRPETAYFVAEQRVMKAEAIFTGENWAWALISDTCRYLTPLLLAYVFHPSCKRLSVDLRLVMERRLTWRQVRHPVINFFRSYRDFNQAMQRINVVKAAPRGAEPWSRNL